MKTPVVDKTLVAGQHAWQKTVVDAKIPQRISGIRVLDVKQQIAVGTGWIEESDLI